MMLRDLVSFTVVVAALGSAGCQSADAHALEPGEAYCGSLVSAPVFHEGFVSDDAPPNLRLRLELDVNALSTRPGTLTTDDDDRGLCSADDDALFDHAELRTIPEVLHDPISTAIIGEGRDQHVFAYVDSNCAGTMLAVISLMRNGDVEVRLFKPATATSEAAPARDRSGFALFTLQRRKLEDCGF